MKIDLETRDSFALRHIGPDKIELQEMLRVIRADSLDSLIEETIPSAIRLKSPLNLPKPVSEYRFLEDLRKIAKQNKDFKT